MEFVHKCTYSLSLMLAGLGCGLDYRRCPEFVHSYVIRSSIVSYGLDWNIAMTRPLTKPCSQVPCLSVHSLSDYIMAIL